MPPPDAYDRGADAAGKADGDCPCDASSADRREPQFIPIELERSAVTAAQEITIELRRGATVVKVGWPLAAAAECAGWLRELLR